MSMERETGITDPMVFANLDVWGYVDFGTKVADTEGNQYTVGPQNEAGFRPLWNTSGGEDKAFEALDEIDHDQFRLSG